jgi:hypothetical protein
VDADTELTECVDELTAKRSQLAQAMSDGEAARVELREIAAEAERMSRFELALGQEAATEALRMRAACLNRVCGACVVEDPPDRELVGRMPTPPVFDPYQLVPDAQREERA